MDYRLFLYVLPFVLKINYIRAALFTFNSEVYTMIRSVREL